MSTEDIVISEGSTLQQTSLPETDQRPKYKSWRKKFRKMKARFDDVLKHNHTMFKEEQKLEALAQRLQETNDQLLDMLLDLNSSLATPADQRYNIKFRENWMDREGTTFDGANNLLAEAYEMDQQGRYSHAQYAQLRSSLEEHLAAKDVRSLASLEKTTPHPVYDLNDPDTKRIIDTIADPVTYLTTNHEEEHLNRLDSKNSGGTPLTPETRSASPPSFSNMSAREIDREVELRNPLSVHNWLKKHNVTIGDGEEKSEAGATPANGKKTTSRNLAKKVGDRAIERARERDDGSPMSSARTDLDAEDELGLEDVPKRRKSRDADETYRPKGGRSGKSKRKREDGERTSIGGNKKPRTSVDASVEN